MSTVLDTQVALPPSRSYFTLFDGVCLGKTADALRGDGYDVHQAAELAAKSLERNLKSALLLQDSVVFRATAPLTCEASGELLADARVLVEKGILIPEVRLGSDPLVEVIQRRPGEAGLTTAPTSAQCELAELIDAAPTPFAVDAEELAKARTTMLIDHLFRQLFFRARLGESYLRNSVDWSDLDRLFRMMVGGKTPPLRQDFMRELQALYELPRRVDVLVQTIYFGVGALAAQANSIWPQHYQITESLWDYPPLEPDAVKDDPKALAIADKYGVLPRLARQYELATISAAARPENMMGILHVHDAVLDRLSFADIVKLRTEEDALASREIVRQIKPSATQRNHSLLWCDKLNREVLREEKLRREAASSPPLISLLLGLACLVVDPTTITSQFMSLFGIGVSVRDAVKDRKRAQIPLLTFGERVCQTPRGLAR